MESTNGNEVEIPRADGSGASDLEWKINRVNQGSTELLVLRLVPQQRRAIELSIKRKFDHPVIDTKVEVQEPKLALELLGADEVLWNAEAIFTLVVTNVGNGNAENLKLDLQQTSSEDKTCMVPELRPGESQEIYIRVVAGKEREHIDIAVTAAGAHELKGEIKRRIKVLRPKLEIKVQTQPLHLVDNPAEVFIRVRNVGNAKAEKVTIRAELPLGAEYVGSNDGGIFTSPQQQNLVEWRGKTFEKGETLTFSLVCRPKREGNCRVSVAAIDPGGKPGEDNWDANSVTFMAEAVTELELAVLKDPNGAVELGQEAVYTIQLKNVGTKAAENVEASMAFGWKMGQNEQVAVLEPIAVHGGKAGHDNGMVVFEKIPQILPKQTVTLKVVVKAIETGNVKIKTEVNGTDIHLTNGLMANVFSRQAAVPANQTR
jgi:hypothetical protein